jgi:hypothetical protein
MTEAWRSEARLVETVGICRALVAAMVPREKDEVK